MEEINIKDLFLYRYWDIYKNGKVEKIFNKNLQKALTLSRWSGNI